MLGYLIEEHNRMFIEEHNRMLREDMKPVIKRVSSEIALEKFMQNSSYFIKKKKGQYEQRECRLSYKGY